MRKFTVYPVIFALSIVLGLGLVAVAPVNTQAGAAGPCPCLGAPYMAPDPTCPCGFRWWFPSAGTVYNPCDDACDPVRGECVQQGQCP